MKQFGTVQSFDEASGHGSITPEGGGSDLGFERRSILWDQMASPRPGVRLSYHLSARNGRATAVDLQTILSLKKISAFNPFTVFRSASEEVATKAEREEWDNEGGQMNSTEGRIVSTPGAELPYKTVLRHESQAETERAFATMKECETFIRRNTPSPIARSTLWDREACAL